MAALTKKKGIRYQTKFHRKSPVMDGYALSGRSIMTDGPTSNASAEFVWSGGTRVILFLLILFSLVFLVELPFFLHRRVLVLLVLADEAK